MFRPIAAAILLTTLYQTAKPAFADPVAKQTLLITKNGPISVEIAQAKWTTRREVSTYFRTPQRCLGVWFSASSTNEFKLPDGLSLSDYILNARIVGPNGGIAPGLPIDPVRSINRSNLGYVPGNNPAGQKIWIFDLMDPRWTSWTLQVEFLRPDAPFTKAELPASILKGPGSESEWLRRFEFPMTATQTPLPEPKAAKQPVASIKVQNASLTILGISRGSYTSSREPGGEATQFLDIPIVVTENGGPSALNIRDYYWAVIDKNGATFPASSVSINDGGFWLPDGRPVGPKQSVFTLRGETRSGITLPEIVTLEGFPRPKREAFVDRSFSNLQLPAPGQTQTVDKEAVQPGECRLRSLRTFTPNQQLPAEIAPDLATKSGVVAVFEYQSRLAGQRVTLEKLKISPMGRIAPLEGQPVAVYRGNPFDKATKGGSFITVIFLFSGTEELPSQATIVGRVTESYETGRPLILFPGLPVPVLKPKVAGP